MAGTEGAIPDWRAAALAVALAAGCAAPGTAAPEQGPRAFPGPFRLYHAGPTDSTP